MPPGDVSLGTAVLTFLGDRSALDRELETLRRETDQLEKQGVRVRVDADTARANRQLDGLRGKVVGVRQVLDQLLAGMRGDGGALEGLSQSLGGVAARAGEGQGAMAGMAGGLGKVVGMASTAIPLLGQVGLAAMGLQAIFHGVAGAVQAVLRPLEQLSAQSGQFNKQVAEASIFTSQAFAVIGPDGKAIEGTANQMRALRGRIVTEFQAIQKETAQISGATSSQIYEVFNILSQNNSGLGRAGEDLSNITRLSTRIAAAMNTLNIPGFHQLRSEVTSLATGQVQAYDQLGMKLYGQGAGEKIRALQAEGKFYDDLIQKLEKLYDGQKVLALSLENVRSNYADVFEGINAAGGQSFERGLARAFQAVLTPLTQLKGSLADMMRSLGEALEPWTALAGLVAATLVPVLSILASILQVVADVMAVVGNLTAAVLAPQLQLLVGLFTVLAKAVELVASLLSALLRPFSVFFRVLSQQNQAAAASPFDAMVNTLDGLILKADQLAANIAKPFIAAAQAAAWLQGKLGGKSDVEIRSKQADIQAEFDNALGSTNQVSLRSINVSPLARQMQQEAEQRYAGSVPEEKQLAKTKEISDIKQRMYRNEITALEQGVKLLSAQKGLQEALNSLAEARRSLEARRLDFRVSLASSPEARQQAEDRRNELAGQQEQQRIRERVATLQSEKAIQQQQLEISIRQAAIQQEQLRIQRAEINVQRIKVGLAAQEFLEKARNAAAGSPEQKALMANHKIQADILQIIGDQLAAADRAVALGAQGEANLRRTGVLEQRRLDIQQASLGVQAESALLSLSQQRLMSSLAQREQAIKNELATRTRIETDLQRSREKDLRTAEKVQQAQERLVALEKSRADLAKARADAGVREAERLMGLAKAQAAAIASPASVEAVIGAQIEALALGRTGFISEAEATRELYRQKALQLEAEQQAARQQQLFQQEREASEQRIALLQLRVQKGSLAIQLMQLETSGRQLRLQQERDQLSRSTPSSRTAEGIVAAGYPEPMQLPQRRPLFPVPRGSMASRVSGNDVAAFTSQQLLAASQSAARFNGIANMCAETVKSFYRALGTTLPGVTAWADTVRKAGTVMRDWSQIRPGDIVATGTPGDTPHVGVYTGNGNVFHQSSRRGLRAGNYPDLDYFRSGYFVRPRADLQLGPSLRPAAMAAGTAGIPPETSLENSLKANTSEAASVRDALQALDATIAELNTTLIPGLQERQGLDRQALAAGQAEQRRAMSVEEQRAMLRAQILETPRGRMGAELTDATVGGIGGAIRAGITEVMRGGDLRAALVQALSGVGDRAMQISLDALLKPLERMLSERLFQGLTGTNLQALQQQAAAGQQAAAAGQQQAALAMQTAAQMQLQAAQLLLAGGGGGTNFMVGAASNLASPFLGGLTAALAPGANPFTGLAMGAGGVPLGFGAGPSLPIPAFARGGISDGPSGGYLAMLHNTEAVVPLPGGRALPVELRRGAAIGGDEGGGGVSIGSIHVDAKGTSVEGDSEAARRLGKWVGDAFHGLLVKEMRPGGEIDRRIRESNS